MMEHFNQTLFLLLNAPTHPGLAMVWLARFIAEDFIWTIPLTLTIGWLYGDERVRHAMLLATVTSLLALAVNPLIGLLWFHPRPFMIGLGHRLIPHAADSSFPSDHLTLLWSASLAMWCRGASRRIGVVLTLAGIPVAWSGFILACIFPSTCSAHSEWPPPASGCAVVWNPSCWRGYMPRCARFTD